MHNRIRLFYFIFFKACLPLLFWTGVSIVQFKLQKWLIIANTYFNFLNLIIKQPPLSQESTKLQAWEWGTRSPLLNTTEPGVTGEESVFSVHCLSAGILSSEIRAVLATWKPESWVPLRVGQGRGGWESHPCSVPPARVSPGTFLQILDDCWSTRCWQSAPRLRKGAHTWLEEEFVFETNGHRDSQWTRGKWYLS